jgi:glutaminyl-tRNA synthetase
MTNHRNPDRDEGGASPAESEGPSNFIRNIIDEDLAAGRHDRIVTRFPPEPNGYLHIGHAKSICLNFGIAADYGGQCNLRFDDTNPIKEEAEFVEAIKRDVRWLGFDWEDREYYASDYYEQLYRWAEELIEKGLAYVDDLSADEIREYRGTLTKPGKESPWRERSVEESLDLFRRMRAGEYPDGSRVLRAKIDMAASNLNLRDPVLYRIRRAHHHRTGDDWLIYPMYDFAHGQSDAIEGITHSLCTLEFEDHRPLYDWFLQHLSVPARPRQIEFARLELSYTVMSKRKLKRLVDEGHVEGWDDPRMPTIAGMRRRGYPPAAIRDFAERIGVAKANSVVDIALLEACLREELNETAPRAMGVLDPIRLVVENYPEDQVEWLEAENNPQDESAGTRQIPFSRVLYIEREDYREDAPRKWFRLAPGREVRLKHAYYVTCTEAVRDDDGKLVELRCTYDPDTRGGWSTDGRKVRGTLHWVSAAHAVPAEIRRYDRLFLEESPEDTDEGEDFTVNLNPESLTVLTGCQLEPGLSGAEVGYTCQFMRKGYFCVDLDSRPDRLVFNEIVGMRDTWAKIEKKLKAKGAKGA